MRIAHAKPEQFQEIIARRGPGVREAVVKVYPDGAVDFDCDHPRWKATSKRESK